MDRDLCIGAGACVADAPQAFKFDDENIAVPQPGAEDLPGLGHPRVRRGGRRGGRLRLSQPPESPELPPESPAPPRTSPDRLVDAVEALQDRYDQIEVAGRTIRLETPVNGDAGFAALRMLGIAQAAFPVGVATHSPNGVAIGVWN
ncbi:MAG: ferredoxin, partial [Acidimicrobiia bacterium]